MPPFLSQSFNCSSFECYMHKSILIFTIYFFVHVVQEGVKVCAPILTGRLLSFFTPEPGISKTDAYITAALLSLVVLTEGAVHAPNFFKNTRHGLHLRIAAGSLIYRKVGQLESVCQDYLKHLFK